MLITREYDYALRILRALAQNGQLAVHQICAAEHIPQPYSYKILKKLEKASFVKSHRGALGGYQLVAPPQDVNMYDIYVAIEGNLYLNECLKEDFVCPNNEDGCHCTVHRELCHMQSRFIEDLRRRTLAALLQGDE